MFEQVKRVQEATTQHKLLKAMVACDYKINATLILPNDEDTMCQQKHKYNFMMKRSIYANHRQTLKKLNENISPHTRSVIVFMTIQSRYDVIGGSSSNLRQHQPEHG
jgi:hypothetical protein